MKLIYEININGFENVYAPKTFFRNFLEEGKKVFLKRAIKAIKGGKKARRDCNCRHGNNECLPPSYKHIACMGQWCFGDVYNANSHCLEIFQDDKKRYFFIDQYHKGRLMDGYCDGQKVIEELL